METLQSCFANAKPLCCTAVLTCTVSVNITNRYLILVILLSCIFCNVCLHVCHHDLENTLKQKTRFGSDPGPTLATKNRLEIYMETPCRCSPERPPTWRTETNRNICYRVLLQKHEFILRVTHKRH